MHVSDDHLKQLDRAIDTAEPLLLLPSLHPRYIQSLLGLWAGAQPKREVVLIESFLGRQLVKSSGIEARGGTDEAQDLTDWLLAHRPGPDDISPGWRIIWWVPDLEADWDQPRTRSVVTSLCRRIASLGLHLHLAIRAPSGAVPLSLQAWTRPVELLTPKASEDDQDSFALDVLRSAGPQLRAERAALAAVLEQLQSHNLPAHTELSSMLQGLDAAAINIVIEAVARWGRDHTVSDPEASWKALKAHLSQERARQLQRASGLTIEQPSGEALQGMPRFQRYLEYVSVLFHDRRFERKEGGPTPRGVLLVGLPGCGKSLAARVTAQKLEVPLLRLDVGGMMGRHLGESEANLSRALDAAEAAAPCVLWVDELEKALGGLGDSSEGGGTGKRMLGKLLTWMQEHDSSVYLFATANKVKDLPPELLRRGRFDELWRVMLPKPDERAAILRSKLQDLGDECDAGLRKKDSKGLSRLVKETKDFTGADLTSLVREAWMRQRVFEKPVDEAALREVLKGDFQPMSAQFSDKIKADVEALEKHGFRDVWCEEGALPKPPPADRTGKGGRLVGPLAELWRSDAPMLVVFRASNGKAWRTLVLQPPAASGRSVKLYDGRFTWQKLPKTTMASGVLSRNGRQLSVHSQSSKGMALRATLLVSKNDIPQLWIANDGFSIHGNLQPKPAGVRASNREHATARASLPPPAISGVVPKATITLQGARYTLQPRSGRKRQVELLSSKGDVVGSGTVKKGGWAFLILLGTSRKLAKLGLENHKVFWEPPHTKAGSSRVGIVSPLSSKPHYPRHGGNWAGLANHFKS